MLYDKFFKPQFGYRTEISKNFSVLQPINTIKKFIVQQKTDKRTCYLGYVLSTDLQFVVLSYNVRMR